MKKKQNKWLDNFGKADNANESNVSLSDNFNGLAYDTSYRDYSPAWGGQFQQGGSIPGTVGFTYARTAGAAPSKGPYAKKTMASAQNGQEMQFYQEGLDWKPKSMQYGGSEKISTSDPRYPELYKNRQVGAYYDGAFTLPDLDEVIVTAPRSYTMQSLRDATSAALYGAPANVMKLSSFPQALMTEGIEMLRGKPYDFGNANPNFGGFSSNQRDLSMTMGYENPEGFLQNAANIGLSMIDPSLIAGSSSASIGKRFTKDITKNIVNPNKVVFDLMDDSIDPFGEVLKRIKTHQGPTPFAKDVKREAYKYQELTSDPRYLERVRKVDEDFGSALEFKLDKFNNYENENTGTYFPFNISTTDDLPSSINEGGQSLGVSKPTLESELKDYARKEGIYVTNYDPATDREIIINEKAHLQGNEPARGTVHHELKHHWTNSLKDEYGLENQKAYRKALSDLIIPESANEFLPRKDYKYYSDPTEIDAHLMTNMRDEMVKRGYLKDHFDKLTKDKLNDFILKERDYRGVKEYFSPGREMIFDRSKFVNFFNKYGLPSTVIGGVAGSQALEQKRKGGIIVDDRGQWDHPGEITQVNSNYITMGPDPITGKEIDYDVLGVSNTGDTKLMQPGKNYKFKGSKVTEIPMAKLGINQLDAQPMKKLNQLLNFTNNPDKTNWLDKYQ